MALLYERIAVFATSSPVYLTESLWNLNKCYHVVYVANYSKDIARLYCADLVLTWMVDEWLVLQDWLWPILWPYNAKNFALCQKFCHVLGGNVSLIHSATSFPQFWVELHVKSLCLTYWLFLIHAQEFTTESKICL